MKRWVLTFLGLVVVALVGGAGYLTWAKDTTSWAGYGSIPIFRTGE